MPNQVSRLLKGAAEGKTDDWDALVERFAGLLWSTARGHGLGHAHAADVCQTVWLRLVEQLRRLPDPERVGRWLASDARLECIRILSWSQDHVGDRAVPPPSGGPADDDALWRALARLPARCRLLLRVLAAQPAPSDVETSAAVEMARGAVEATRVTCLERLRKEAAGLGWTGGDDVAMLRQLAALATRRDPVPDQVVASARSSFTWHSVDAELAQLIRDSSLEEDDRTVRGGGASRRLTFQAGALAVEVEVAPSPGGVRLLGQLVPVAAASLALRSPRGSQVVQADELGVFAADVPAGPLSVEWEHGGSRYETAWITV